MLPTKALILFAVFSHAAIAGNKEIIFISVGYCGAIYQGAYFIPPFTKCEK
jgi:hypothetical protein